MNEMGGGRLSVGSVARACFWVSALFIHLIVTPAHSSDKTISLLKKNFLKGYTYTQRGKEQKAVRHFSKIRDIDAGMRDYVLFFLGRSLRRLERCDEAKEVFRELATSYPESRWAEQAAGQLESSEPCPSLEIASVLPPKVNCEPVEGDEERADCFFTSRQYAKAKDLYRELCRNPSIFRLTRLSQAASRSQDFATAIEANRTLMNRYPRTPAADEAFRKIAFLYQDWGDFRRAIPLLEELEAKVRSSQEKRHYRERIGWCRFRLGDLKGAVQSLDDAIRAGETPFSLYWKGRSLERLGRRREARELLRNLMRIYGGSYYGVRASEKLARAGSARGGEGRPWRSISKGVDWEWVTESMERTNNLERIHELTELGLLDDAAIEARRHRIRSGVRLPSDPKKITKNKKTDRFEFQRRIPKGEDADYPLPYADFLFSQVGKWKGLGIDPFLLYAMMRQESRFRESVVSPAGAVGLLQIMPWTGQRLAVEAGWSEYQPKWLFDPSTNIELAVRYVKKLWDLFGGKWYAVAASYNAGERVVAEWLKQRPGLPEEEFIEEIPYRETRGYVKKVYTNWKAYRAIYGGE